MTLNAPRPWTPPSPRRRSVRAYLPTPVPRDTLEAILAVASRAPSGTNTQPWKVHVLTGRRQANCRAASWRAYDDPVQKSASHSEEYAYYPTEWVSPYIDRRRKVGWDLYSLLGIGKADKAAMHAQHAKQLQLLRRAGGADFHRGPRHAPGQLAGLRHVPAKHHGGRARARAGHLPAGGLLPVPPPDRRTAGAAARARWWCAAWRWAMPTRRQWKTR